MQNRELTTIVAIATPLSSGAIGIVRLSGPESLNILKKIFKAKNGQNKFPSHKLQLGQITNFKGQLLDIALAVYFQGPQSFTGEDSAEIQAHGGPVLLKNIVKLCLEAGAQLALAGEFSKRAFLNGKLELSQAEAIIELIEAQNTAEITLAAKQLAGNLKKETDKIEKAIFKIYADLEMALNFQDDSEEINLNNLQKRLQKETLSPLNKLLEQRKSGRILKDGLKIILTGAPNAGKSSLFNALLNEERALVSNISGTTRDYLNAETIWSGLRVELFDTAGLSPFSNNVIEKEGQKKALEKLNEADLILWVKDIKQTNTKEDDYLKTIIPLENTIMVFNKIDLSPNFKKINKTNKNENFISVKKNIGLEELKKSILELISPYADKTLLDKPEALVPNLRQEKILQQTQYFLNNALEAIKINHSAEIISFELQQALNTLSYISGQKRPDDLMAEIFSNFCVGK